MPLRRLSLAFAVVAWLATTAGADDQQIVQRNKAFSVRDTVIATGASLTFVNADTVTHNVFSLTKGQEFEIRTQRPGQSQTITFAKSGVALVECAIHPSMQLRVVVK